MFACLKCGYRCFGNDSWLVLTFLLCCYAPGYHALVVASIPFICLCLLVVHVDVGNGLRCMTAICPEYRCYTCSITPSWLNVCMMALLIFSCMIFVDASDHAMFLRSMYL